MAEFNDDQHWAHCHHHYPHIDIGDVEQNAIVIASIADNKYATIGLAEDPVWNESTEYTANSIVVSDNAMYVSIKQVPAGTEVTDTEYWMQIGSINQVAINDVNVTVDNEIGIPSAEASADEEGNLSIDFHNLKGVTSYDELLNKPEIPEISIGSLTYRSNVSIPAQSSERRYITVPENHIPIGILGVTSVFKIIIDTYYYNESGKYFALDFNNITDQDRTIDANTITIIYSYITE